MSSIKLQIVALVIAAISLPAAAVGENPIAPETHPRTDLFGDPLPPGALVRMGTIRYAHGDATTGTLALAPDHKTFATVSRFTPYGPGSFVCIWDAATGKELRHFADPDFEPYRAFFLKKENLLGVFGASHKPGADGKTVYSFQCWNPATGKKAPAAGDQMVHTIQPGAISPDESCFACATQQTPVVVCERKTGKMLAKWNGAAPSVNNLAFTSDGKALAVDCRTAVHLWNWKGDGKDRLVGDFPKTVERLWFSPDRRWLAVASFQEGLRILETENLTEVRRFKEEHDIRFSADGKRIVSLKTGSIWDVATGEKRGQLEDGVDCTALDFSADGREIMGYDRRRIRYWDPATGKDHSPPAPAVPGRGISQIGFVAAGKEVVSASADNAVCVWDATTGKELRTLVRETGYNFNKPTFLRTAPDGTIVTTRGDRLTFFNEGGKAEEFPLTNFPGGPDNLDISPDGKTIILAETNPAGSRIELWDVPSRKAVAHFNPPNVPSSQGVAVSSDRRIAVSVKGDAYLLDATGAANRPIRQIPDRVFYTALPNVQALSFSPEGNMVVMVRHAEQQMRLVDLNTSQPRCDMPDAAPLGVIPSPLNARMFSVVFSPNGQMIAADLEDGVVDVWETNTGKRRRRFRGHRSFGTTLVFSPDNQRLATANRDRTILIWDVFGTSTGGEADAGPLAKADLDALWTRLGESDAESACLAMGRLMRRPDDAAPYLKQRLLSRKPADVARLKRCIVDLDDDAFDVREAAEAELAKRLPEAEPLLRASLAANPSAEARHRIEALLARLIFYPLSPETLGDLRALEILETAESTISDEMVQKLTEGNHDALVAAAAKAARMRMTVKDR